MCVGENKHYNTGLAKVRRSENISFKAVRCALAVTRY